MSIDKQHGKTAEPAAFYGTRKLIRPHLPPGGGERRRDATYTEEPLTHAALKEGGTGNAARESSHAEAFYFQKQIQQHTEMTVVLDDGEQLTGVLEWYDKWAIKLRAGRRRVLVYKSGIRYLFKASESSAAHSVMK